MAALQAVTFDYWNTLMRIPPSAQWDRRVDGFTDLLIAEGHDVTREHLEAAFDAMRRLHEQAWIDNRQHGAAEAVADVLAAAGIEPAPGVVDQHGRLVGGGIGFDHRCRLRHRRIRHRHHLPAAARTLAPVARITSPDYRHRLRYHMGDLYVEAGRPV